MIMINVLGLLLIALIVWWFWLYKPQNATVGANDLVITVENGTYTPTRIKVIPDKPITLTFLRKDPSPCAETVVIPDLQISESLPLNTKKGIALPAMAVGEYPFHCQMQMYRGSIVVQ